MSALLRPLGTCYPIILIEESGFSVSGGRVINFVRSVGNMHTPKAIQKPIQPIHGRGFHCSQALTAGSQGVKECISVVALFDPR